MIIENRSRIWNLIIIKLKKIGPRELIEVGFTLCSFATLWMKAESQSFLVLSAIFLIPGVILFAFDKIDFRSKFILNLYIWIGVLPFFAAIIFDIFDLTEETLIKFLVWFANAVLFYLGPLACALFHELVPKKSFLYFFDFLFIFVTPILFVAEFGKEDLLLWDGKIELSFMFFINIVYAIYEWEKKQPNATERKYIVLNNLICKIDAEALVQEVNSPYEDGGSKDIPQNYIISSRRNEECKSLYACRTGDSIILLTDESYNKYTIYTVGLKGDKADQMIDDVKNCYLNSLELARENSIHSIAFPLISAGRYGLQAWRIADIAVNTVSKWLDENQDYVMEIAFYSGSNSYINEITNSLKKLEHNR